jgi:hypothetical protein
VGVRHFRHHRRLAIDRHRHRAEGAHALERFLLAGAGAHERQRLHAGEVPGAQLPGHVEHVVLEVVELVPALVQLQRGAGHRLVGDHVGVGDIREAGLDEAVPVKREHHGRVRVGDRGHGDADERQAVCDQLALDAVEQLHASIPPSVDEKARAAASFTRLLQPKQLACAK